MTSAHETEHQTAAQLACQSRGLTLEEEDALQAWAGAPYLNKAAYLRLKSVWQRADRLAAPPICRAYRRKVASYRHGNPATARHLQI